MKERLKTLGDFPHFEVSKAIANDLIGRFDVSKGVDAGRCWLLLPGRTALIGDVSGFDPETGSATFNSADETNASLVGQKLPYLSAYWQAYHVWMVLDGASGWDKVGYQAVDAIGDAFATDDGKNYRRLRRAKPGEVLSAEDRLVPHGWDHEHCELCNTHIDPGHNAYSNSEGLWICVRCFDRYVSERNLAFVDEL